MRARVLLFDLDGTLTDPKPGIVRCIRYALDRLAMPCPSDDTLTAYIGPPLRETFSALLGTVEKEPIEEAVRLFRLRFADTGLYENEVYAGIPEMLDSLRRSEAAMFLATSKPKIYADRIVKHFGLDRYFTAVYGAELDGRYDNKADLLAHLLAMEKIPPAAAVMVGDRASDVAAAKANGVRSIGVLWGYGSEDELAGAGADRLCAKPGEILVFL
ncbi:MAG: HAD hydrolase-like protein [Bacteroidota bacterium]